jgi:hypothetical protein
MSTHVLLGPHTLPMPVQYVWFALVHATHVSFRQTGVFMPQAPVSVPVHATHWWLALHAGVAPEPQSAASSQATHEPAVAPMVLHTWPGH